MGGCGCAILPEKSRVQAEDQDRPVAVRSTQTIILSPMIEALHSTIYTYALTFRNETRILFLIIPTLHSTIKVLRTLWSIE